MCRGFKLAVLGLATLCLWVAAPALSTSPYMPEAVDFEQRLPALERVTARGGADARGGAVFRSGTIASPERFDLVGVARERRPISYRARLSGGEWSPWVEASNGDPVYTGGSDELQLRAHGWRPRGRLHYVNVSGTTSAADTVLNEVRGAINSAFIAAAATVEPAASADVAKPEIVRRGEWGANRDRGGCLPRTSPSYGKVKAAAVHHTVTTNDYTEAEAPGIVLGICRYHRNSNGWNDIGYNALVDRFGNIYEGRDGGLRKAVVGAHAQGYNAQTTGVSVIGTHTTLPFSKGSLNAASRFLAWKFFVHGLPAKGKVNLVSGGGDVNRYPAGTNVRVARIFPHGKVNYTACPGDGGRQRLDELREKVAHKLGG